jgi:ankyrin repeat protein
MFSRVPGLTPRDPAEHLQKTYLKNDNKTVLSHTQKFLFKECKMTTNSTAITPYTETHPVSYNPETLSSMRAVTNSSEHGSRLISSNGKYKVAVNEPMFDIGKWSADTVKAVWRSFSKLASWIDKATPALSFPIVQASSASTEVEERVGHLGEEKIQPALCQAIEDGDLGRAKKNLEQKIQLNTLCCVHGCQSPLYIAVIKGELSITEALLQYGANPNQPSAEGNMPLHVAVIKGELSITEALLKHNADPDILNTAGRSSLHIAVIERDLPITKALLKHGANPNLLNAKGRAALHVAVLQGDLSITEELLTHRADPSQSDGEGRTPLHLAAQHDGYSIAKALLSHGANPSAVDSEGKTPLGVARANRHSSLITLLETSMPEGFPNKKDVDKTRVSD